MREILFRGKSVLDNKWIYGTVEFHLVDGDLTQTRQDAFITYDSMDRFGEVYRDRYEVVLTTIGQFTGLTDKNGVKIFEGDIVKKEDEIGTIRYEGNYCTFAVILKRNTDLFQHIEYKCEVIGNIYNNPEMLNK